MALFNKLKRSYKRRRWAEVAAKSPLKVLYEQASFASKLPASEADFLIVDCEMSGLSAQKNELLSIGWVKVKKLQLDFSSRRHVLVHARQSVGDSVVIHGLSDSNIAGAANPARALSLLAQDMLGSVLVFHHAVLDLAFLQKAAMQHCACPLTFQYIDTMDIERRLLEKQGKTGAMQLNLCRERYHLPPASEHNAMYDAIATAELLLAQCAYLGASRVSLAGLGMRQE